MWRVVVMRSRYFRIYKSAYSVTAARLERYTKRSMAARGRTKKKKTPQYAQNVSSAHRNTFFVTRFCVRTVRKNFCKNLLRKT